ncbi:hypothetical protein BX666DRAFT_1874655 [Dichotomocladium elegans]|nr:hypothetical protein BX666DRAFT_1874655 [Dichotomocladium elegans]
MDSPAGAVCRVTKVGLYEFSRSEKQFAKKIIGLLALVWQIRKIMENSADVVNMDTTLIMPSIEEPAEFHKPPECHPPKYLTTGQQAKQDGDLHVAKGVRPLNVSVFGSVPRLPEEIGVISDRRSSYLQAPRGTSKVKLVKRVLDRIWIHDMVLLAHAAVHREKQKIFEIESGLAQHW